MQHAMEQVPSFRCSAIPPGPPSLSVSNTAETAGIDTASVPAQASAAGADEPVV
jgi:hypothetical protein